MDIGGPKSAWLPKYRWGQGCHAASWKLVTVSCCVNAKSRCAFCGAERTFDGFVDGTQLCREGVAAADISYV